MPVVEPRVRLVSKRDPEEARRQTASGIRAFNFHGALNFGLCDILEDHVAPEVLASVRRESR